MKIIPAFLLWSVPAWAQCTGYGTQISAQFQQVTGTLTSYTATIAITDPRLATVPNGGLSQSGGNDICISDGANIASFPLQIRGYNAATGAYSASVQVPGLSALAPTIVKVWVGKAGVSDPSTTAVWDANFVQVYPLQEICTPDSSTAGCFKDATSHAAHSTGGKYPTRVAGLLGNAQSFVSASAEVITVPNQVAAGTTITISGWFKTSSTAAVYTMYEQHGNSNGGCRTALGAATGFVFVDCGGNGNEGYYTGSANLADGLWHHFALTNTGNTVSGYVDGVFVGSGVNTQGAVVFTAGSSLIGQWLGGIYPWNGSLQDIRVSNSSRSAAWIKADYDSFHAPGTFFALTAPVPGPTITMGVPAYTNLSAYSAVFTWSTGAAKADSQVDCGASGGPSGGPYTTYTTQISDSVQIGSSDYWGVTAHRLGVNLPASYSGHCIVLSTNQAGGTATSADQVVTTPAAPVNVPIGVAYVSPRVNLTNGPNGYNGDIDFLAATADGEWIMAGNDGQGKVAGNGQYCCDDSLHISKWPTMVTRYMLLGQDTSTPAAPIHNVIGPSSVFGGNRPYWVITGGTCAANVATVNFEDRGYTIPVGTPIWVAAINPVLAANPAGYNAANTPVLAFPAPTNTSVSYSGTCGSSAWISGGTVTVWNDGSHQFSFGIDSVNGLVCIDSWRAVSPFMASVICSTDYFAHSFNNGHNPPGGPVTVPNYDLPLPSTPCFFGAGCALPATQLQVAPCRDYGGVNQTAFPCTWLAGDENYIYTVGTLTQTTSGYSLFRHAYADHKRVDGTLWQAYTGAQVCDDRMLYNANWSSTLSSGTVLNSQISTYGNSFSIVTAPDFNGFVGANWTALASVNISQSAGSTVYDMGPWLTCTAIPIGSVNRDEKDINYFPTWSFMVPASYATVSASNPIRATVQLRQSGSAVNISGNPATEHYGPNLYTIGLAPRWTGPKGNGGPIFSSAGGKHGSFLSYGLDLFYTFQDTTGTRVVTNSSPNDTLGTYSTTLPQTQIALYDRYGLFSFGFPANGVYGSGSPYPFFFPTPYAAQNTDFTLAVVFSHQNSANTGPPAGECVVNRASLKICRNGTAANSWLVTVGTTASGPLAVSCDAGTFCGIIVNRVGSTAKVYSTAGIQPNTFPLTALATITDGATLAADALVIGAKADGTLQFQGWISALAVYKRGLSDNELQQFAGALRTFEAGRGITLP